LSWRVTSFAVIVRHVEASAIAWTSSLTSATKSIRLPVTGAEPAARWRVDDLRQDVSVSAHWRRREFHDRDSTSKANHVMSSQFTTMSKSDGDWSPAPCAQVRILLGHSRQWNTLHTI
jgi:hypothetical protein